MKNTSLTAVNGLQVGHFTHDLRPTGCTVVLTPQGAVAGVDVRGAAPGTRETDLLAPTNSVPHIHGLLLTGGSAYGLDAATGVMQWLEEHGHGIAVGPVRVPIVPASVVFDLGVDDFAKHTSGSRIRPDAQAGYLACLNASALPVAQGNVGAGAGATVGKLNGPLCAMRGGVGSAALTVQGITVAALVVCNALGDIVHPLTGELLAGARQAADSLDLLNVRQAQLSGHTLTNVPLGSNTTIGVIATDAPLNKAQCQRLAQVAHDGLARSIRPVHTPMDGDTLFALSTGNTGESNNSGKQADMMLLSTLAAEVTAMAVVNAIEAATSLRIGSTWWPAKNNR
jgi:L-aminopeptidase/D-esterase-like protein